MRHFEVKDSFRTINSVAEFKKARPEINFRYLAMPTEPLTDGFDKLAIDKKHIDPMIALGQEDGLDLIKKGEGFYFDSLEVFDFKKARKQPEFV